MYVSRRLFCIGLRRPRLSGQSWPIRRVWATLVDRNLGRKPPGQKASDLAALDGTTDEAKNDQTRRPEPGGTNRHEDRQGVARVQIRRSRGSICLVCIPTGHAGTCTGRGVAAKPESPPCSDRSRQDSQRQRTAPAPQRSRKDRSRSANMCGMSTCSSICVARKIPSMAASAKRLTSSRSRRDSSSRG